jgi:hypothetical protein
MGTGMNVEPHMAPWPEGPYYRVDKVDAVIRELEAERDKWADQATRNLVAWNDALLQATLAEAERDAARADAERLRQDAERLDHIERTFSGMTNRERYLPVTMGWGKPCMGRTLREACDKYMKRDAARSKE